jgi:hypothetical protein
LASGPYLLTVSMAISGNSGISSCVSQTIGGQPPGFAAVFVPTPVQVNHTGNAIAITPDDPAATFRMQLQVAGAGVTGTASGQYRSTGTTIGTTISVAGPGAGGTAAAAGTVGPETASGFITGTVSVDSMSCTNNGHSWLLLPRP